MSFHATRRSASPRWVAVTLGLVLGAACGAPGLSPDSGADDGGVFESDGGVSDAGDDAGTTDAGAPDAGGPDSGTPDGGDPDAGTPDAGTPDAGYPCTAGGIPGSCVDVAECIDTRTPTAGLCPGAANIQCCTPRFAVACDPNARLQPNLGLVEGPGDGGCPSGMLRVATFCVDRFEAAVEEVLADGGARAWSPYFNPGSTRVRALSLPGAVPQGYISGLQAAAACAEAGKRLCTDVEWQRACEGPAGLTYPYGAARQPGACNDARAVHPAVELYGTSASWIFSHLDSPCLNQLDGGLARAGVYSGCVTAEGLFDMMGNLHEWTSDPNGTFRGGFYVDTVLNGNGCLYATTAHASSYWDYSTGFRCCHD